MSATRSLLANLPKADETLQALAILGAPETLRGLALISRQLTQVSATYPTALVKSISSVLVAAPERLRGVVPAQDLDALSPLSPIGQLADPRLDHAHPFRGICQSRAPIWTLLTVAPPLRCREDWLAARAIVISAALHLQQARLNEGPPAPSDAIFGRDQSAIEAACLSLRRIAQHDTSELRDFASFLDKNINDQCLALDQRTAEAEDAGQQWVARIASLLRLAAGLRGYGHGGVRRGNRSENIRIAPADPSAIVAMPAAEETPNHTVIGETLWEADSDGEISIPIASKLTLDLAAIQDLDEAPHEHAVDPIAFVERECESPDPIALVAAKAQARKHALARQAIPYRYALGCLTPSEKATVRARLWSPLSADSADFPLWFMGAAVALTGRVATVHCGCRDDAPTLERSVVFRADTNEWLVYSPHPPYQSDYTSDQQRLSRIVSTSLSLHALSWLTPHAKALVRRGPVAVSDSPSEPQVLELFGLEGRRRLSALAQPLRSAIRDLTGDGVDIGLITGEMPRDGATQAYYTTRRSHDLATVHAQALEHLYGIPIAHPASTSTDGACVGAYRCPLDNVVQGLVRDLQSGMLANATGSSPVAFHNLYTAYVAVMLTVGLAARGVVDPIPDAVSLTCSLYVWADKDAGNDYHTRAGLMPRMVCNQIAAYRRHRIATHACILQEWRGTTLPFLFLLDENRLPQPFRPSDLYRLAPSFGLPINALRRWVRTRLIEMEVPPSLVDAFLGHWILGREAWGPYSSLSPRDLADTVIPAVDALMRGIGMRVIEGMQP